ncbi:alpha/beta hydrolase fold domain-containing protein [Actinosynnema pretiosum]|uniref:Carboxylesterase n=1 Tax=Actinosynnema pretiosum TaxID=42197 RepID=A0A290Z680_9PSEU|nr:alpha/beta hydrolase fold domain-containing protein [Actinosynnema pretiosum]ATE54537.1 carboxylesterase [Actinosynnema pretiosum]
MSLLSRPAVADAVARRLKSFMTPRGDPATPYLGARGRVGRVVVPTRHGGVPCAVYHPPADVTPAGSGAYLNLHGGGFAIGYPGQDDSWCRYLAAETGVVVLNADYATTPEHRFPVPVEQTYDVLAWAAEPERDWDGSRLCVGGQSAGGSLAAGAARLALERGGPAVALQVLHYAPLDLVTPGRDKRLAGPKSMLRPWMAEVFDTAYIPDPAARRDRLASPAWGDNGVGIEGIAPAVVITCEHDRLRDEGVAYARALDAAGALAEHHEVRGYDHGYNFRGGAPREVVDAVYARIAGHVRRAVGEG